MIKEVSHRTLTPEQLAILSDIFRILPREIRNAADKDKLAPGELGIDYIRGEIWVRNPHTGKLFSPNNAERLKTLGRKIIPGTDKFNADLVHGITFYTDIIELDKLGEAYTPDSVIRQIHAPGIFFGRVEYENYSGYGWPSPSGNCLCIKAHEDSAIIRFYADTTGTTYVGQYNHQKHLFEGWSSDSSGSNVFETTQDGDNNNIVLDIPQAVQDFTTIYITTNTTIYPGAEIAVNGNPSAPLLQIDGNPLDHEIVENTSIMLIYDASREAWIYLDRTETVTSAMLQLIADRVAAVGNGADADISEMRDEMTEMYKGVQTQLNTQSTTMQGQLSSLREQHDRDIKELRDAYDAKIRELETRLETLQKKVDSYLIIMDIPEPSGDTE